MDELKRHIRLTLFAVLVFLFSLPAFAWTPELPKNDVGVGPSAAYVYGPDHGMAVNVDTAFSIKLFSVSGNLALYHFPESSTTFGGGQVEATFWFIANMGVGGGYLAGDMTGPTVHTFVGLPIGDDILPKAMKPFDSFYVEPYVRCHFFFPDEYQFMVEAGIFFKITTYAI